ncbi:MAG: O-antigen ligase family protein [Candidatus Omnitrophica bacterium]|nr:O-antigen ligase family protein [Candidatus Omnitrophota bacterium]
MDTYTEKIEKRYNRIIVFFYCLAIASLPVSIALVESMAAFVIFLFFLKKVLLCRYESQGKRMPDILRIILASSYPKGHFLNKWIGLHVMSIFISVVFSQYPMISLIAFVGKFLEGYLLYFSFVDCVRTKSALRNCVGVFVVTACVMAIDGLFQYSLKWDLIRHLPLIEHRVSTTFRHANDFGAYLVTFIPMVFGLVVLPKRRSSSIREEWRLSRMEFGLPLKIILFVNLIFMLISLGLTFSRGSWMGFWISMLVFVVILRKYFVTVILISLVFVAAFLPLMMKYRDVSFTTDSVNLVRDYSKIDSHSEEFRKLSAVEQDRVRTSQTFQLGMGRTFFWEEAWEVIRKYPFFGSGLNTYSKLVNVYAHNCYLQMAGETGIIGLVFFLLLMGVLIGKSAQYCIKMPVNFYKVVLAGAIAGFVGFLSQSFFDTTLYSVQLGNLMWVMMGLMGAIPSVYAQSKAE